MVDKIKAIGKFKGCVQCVLKVWSTVWTCSVFEEIITQQHCACNGQHSHEFRWLHGSVFIRLAVVAF